MEEFNNDKNNEDELFRKLQNMFNNLFPNNGTPFDMHSMNISNPDSLLDNFFRDNDGITYKTTTYTTEDGTKVTISAGYSDLSPKQNTMSKTAKEKIELLEKKLEKQLEFEEYEKAAETRDLIKSLKENPTKNDPVEDIDDIWNFG